MSSRDKILARRAHFIAAAMTSLIGCSSSDASESADTGAQPCLSADVSFDTKPTDTGPTACLSQPFDSGKSDTTVSDTAVTDTAKEIDTGPMPCLAPPPGDTG